jgi:methylthioribose-1-phosphate isomerase
VTAAIAPVRWSHDRLVLLDQTLLPSRELERTYARWEDVADAIRTLVVRGAPAIGVAAAYGVVLAARQSAATTGEDLIAALEPAFKGLAATRPTAVNLFWALDRMRRVLNEVRQQPASMVRPRLLEEAHAILKEDIAANRALGDFGAPPSCLPTPASSPIATRERSRRPATAPRSGSSARRSRRASSRCCGWTRRGR